MMLERSESLSLPGEECFGGVFSSLALAVVRCFLGVEEGGEVSCARFLFLLSPDISQPTDFSVSV